jgi:hypothetical protein
LIDLLYKTYKRGFSFFSVPIHPSGLRVRGSVESKRHNNEQIN